MLLVLMEEPLPHGTTASSPSSPSSPCAILETSEAGDASYAMAFHLLNAGCRSTQSRKKTKGCSSLKPYPLAHQWGVTTTTTTQGDRQQWCPTYEWARKGGNSFYSKICSYIRLSALRRSVIREKPGSQHGFSANFLEGQKLGTSTETWVAPGWRN